ncbi:MAG: 30S ribosomal protein S1 [Spirochaetales bacterium]|nr:30S ribosomal protein S1 [Spirochaetales bacterium]
MVLAIDGPAGSGKSTIARKVAEKSDMQYLNSGNLYRAATYSLLEKNIQPDTPVNEIASTLKQIQLGFSDNRYFVNGFDVSDHLHTDLIDSHVAEFSAIPELREMVNRFMRTIVGKGGNFVVEGRDIATVVFPDADRKIYLDASVETRARRRYSQGTSDMDYESILGSIKERDTVDKNKPTGSLKMDQDSIYLDTTDLTIEEVCERVLQISKEENQTFRRSQSAIMEEKEVQNTQESDVQKKKQNADGNLQEELQEAYLKSMEQVEEGQLIDGIVIEVDSEFVFVDVGYKSEGKIPRNEFDTIPEVGSSVPVIVVKKETVNGSLVVSKRKADIKVIWKNLKDAFQDHKPVEGTFSKSIKGGFEVDLGHGISAFVPMSKADIGRIHNPESLIGVKSHFYIERLYSNNRTNIVLSRRDWLVDELERKRSDFFENVQEGDVVTGTVKSFTSFGAFIDLGGFDGLLHINDMSWGHATRPKDFVKKGETVDLKVIKLDPEEKKINLSLKHMKENPWENFDQEFEVGDVIHGQVTKLTDFGAFVEIKEGVEGLVHISELSWIKRINHPKEVLSPGDEVEAKILAYDLEQQRVSLGIKQVQSNPWDDIDEKYPVGMRLTRPVKKVVNSGAFVELEEGIDAFLHVGDLSWTERIKQASDVVEEGQEIEVMVISIDKREHKIRVGVKQLSEDPWKALARAYPKNSIIEGEVTNITDFGAFVRVQGDIEGLINKNQLADPKVHDTDQALAEMNVGDHVRCVVMDVNPKQQKLALSIRELDRKEQEKELAKYIQDDEEDEHTVTLGEFLNRDEEE